MGRHLEDATTPKRLEAAWLKIRANGRLSSSEDTRSAIESFSQNAKSNIKTIQSLVRAEKFEFDAQIGVLKRKKGGKNRGIVLASVRNRVVERAFLDYLQDKSEYVKQVIREPTSVGGVPERSVPHGLKLIRDAIASGKVYFVRSDISGFFDNIPRDTVLKKIEKEIDDPKFLTVLRAATAVVLKNEEALGEDRKAFPTDHEGVAQGSPLSPLFGNILLNDFDKEFNKRGITCVRFIDDFVLLGENEKNVKKAYKSAAAFLSELGLPCHDPFDEKTPADKAVYGHVDKGFVFLGYDVFPKLLQPSQKARDSLKEKVYQQIKTAQGDIIMVKRAKDSFAAKQKYVQAQTTIDRVIRGWGEAFAYSTDNSTLLTLDAEIDKQIVDFRGWFTYQLHGGDWKTRRRLGGICLLEDIRGKSLDQLPRRLNARTKARVGAKALTISTDGAAAGQGRRPGIDQGPGGWAFIVHSPDVERSGRVQAATNNQMELRAVIEAIRYAGKGASVVVRTDSQYVNQTVNKEQIVRANLDLWKEFEALCEETNVKITWVKGHNGDPHNERADKLAGEAAKRKPVGTSSSADPR